MIDIEEIKKYLSTTIIGNKILSFDSIDSTNTYAKNLCTDNTQNGTVIIAEEQTQGRGRFNRIWQSEKGKNLTFSIILQPTTKLENIGLLPICTGGAIARAIEQQTNLKTECKWPNDILILNRKVCGILIESFLSNNFKNRFVLGIGINVNQEIFSDDIIHTATSLKQSSGNIVDRIQLLSNVLKSLDEMYLNLQNGNFDIPLNEWLSRSSMFGKEITVHQDDKVLRGKAVRLDNDGSLVLNCDGKEMKVFSGDVTIRKQL